MQQQSPSTVNASVNPAHLGLQARLRWAQGLCNGLPTIAQKLGHLLTQESDSGNMSDFQASRDAWSRYTQNQERWLQGCLGAFREALRQAQQAVLNPASQPAAAVAGGKSADAFTFELLSDDAVENKIISSRLALALGDTIHPVFDTLRVRTQALEDKELAAQDLLRAEVICQTIVDQWLAAGLKRADLQRVLDTMQAELGKLMVVQYKAVHAFFDEHGVTQAQDVAMKVRRTESAGTSSGHGSLYGGSETGWEHTRVVNAKMFGDNQSLVNAMQASLGAEAAVGMSVLARARNRAAEVVGQLRRVLGQSGVELPSAAGGGAGNGAAGGASMGGFGGAGGAGTGYGAGGAPGAVGGSAGGMPLRMPIASPALNQALLDQHRIAVTQYQGMAATAPMVMDFGLGAINDLVSMVRERSADLKQKAETTNEKAIIEVVALMFQSILTEDRVPPSIRVWFARLQVPVLRVALAEPDFFSNLNHPARALIDRMGSCVMGFDAAAISGSKLEMEVRRIVQVVEQYPETGQKVFVLVLREFENFLASNLTESQQKSQIVSVAQKVEHKETLAIQYTIELRSMLSDMPVREEIRDFLFKVWTDVLALATVRFGPKDEQTLRYKQGASTLIWAASAKPSRQERAKVLQTLPGLLQTLRDGLTLAGVIGDKQASHIAVLKETLTQAFMSKSAAIPQERLEALARRLERLEEFIDADGMIDEVPLSPDSIELILGVETAGLHVISGATGVAEPAMVDWAKSLQLGRWFALDHNGTIIQVQYAWHSERRQLHLFASLDGQCYLLQLRRMAVYLQSGLLTVHDEDSLTLRATRDALQKIEANPERLRA